jgi:hypothetical protein
MSRQTLASSGFAATQYDPFGNPTPIFLDKEYTDQILVYGSGHYGYPDFPPNRNIGGPFRLYGVKHRWGWTNSEDLYSTTHLRYNGSLRGTVSAFPMWDITGTPNSSIDGSGLAAAAYNRMKPAQPSFQALNAIYELRELPEMLRARFLSQGLKSIPNYWLALQFGWKPLLNDIRNFIKTHMNAQKRLKQLLRDNGKPVQRRITMVDEIYNQATADGTNYGAFLPLLVTQFYSGVPRYRATNYSRNRVWASARFRYWLPPGPRDISWTRNMMARIYGLNPAPSVVYNAIPWSWLVDWFTSLGDLIENLEPGVADRLAADYFYVMRSQEQVRTTYNTGTFRHQDGSKVELSAYAESKAFIKDRTVGNPFGFTLPQLPLSGMQLSILGALGLSRL